MKWEDRILGRGLREQVRVLELYRPKGWNRLTRREVNSLTAMVSRVKLMTAFVRDVNLPHCKEYENQVTQEHPNHNRSV
jgi:hypothetical protein